MSDVYATHAASESGHDRPSPFDATEGAADSVSHPFELHFTFSCDAPDLQQLAERHLGKLTLIELSQGAFPEQPMLTLYRTGTLAQTIDSCSTLALQFSEGGFEVRRIKMEVALSDALAPATSEEAKTRPRSCYFENHIKLLLAPEDDLALITRLGAHHHAHLSRNARRTRGDGFQERFLTQRFFDCGSEFSYGELDRLVTDLKRQNIPVLEVEAEYVVYDSNFQIDHGWISQ